MKKWNKKKKNFGIEHLLQATDIPQSSVVILYDF